MKRHLKNVFVIFLCSKFQAGIFAASAACLLNFRRKFFCVHKRSGFRGSRSEQRSDIHLRLRVIRDGRLSLLFLRRGSREYRR